MNLSDAYKLFHDGSRALAIAERRGIRIDMAKLEDTIKTQHTLAETKNAVLLDMEEGRKWNAQYGKETSFLSTQQLTKVLSEYGMTLEKADKAVLSKIESEFVKRILELRRTTKLAGSLEGIKREVANDGRLHPSFHLHGVSSYRSSSSNPNFQNFAVRDPEAAKLIRGLFIPSDGYRILESDFAGIEVRASAFYNLDPTLINYIKDKTTDMHKDMASQCYALPKDKVTKQIRYCGKNMFVFPSFYGSYYKQTAPHLWDAMSDMKLTLPDGSMLSEHVKSKIGDKEAFTEHIKTVEDDFWGNRFKVYSAWKKKHYETYLQNGEFYSLTGFRFNGVYRKNQVINLPVQSVAFHCLLWSFIEMTKIMVLGKWKSGLIGQIHDSLVCEIHESEYDKFKPLVIDVMTKRLPAAWDFINVPLEVELEATEVNGSWFTKKVV